jgi:hypothetical protein
LFCFNSNGKYGEHKNGEGKEALSAQLHIIGIMEKLKVEA